MATLEYSWGKCAPYVRLPMRFSEPLRHKVCQLLWASRLCSGIVNLDSPGSDTAVISHMRTSEAFAGGKGISRQKSDADTVHKHYGVTEDLFAIRASCFEAAHPTITPIEIHRPP